MHVPTPRTACSTNNTYRDVKPDNLLLRGGDVSSLRLIDFGSAVDAHSQAHLYGDQGPTDAQQTEAYAPPESLFAGTWALPAAQGVGPAYDVWSAGVVALELLLGTPDVFEVRALWIRVEMCGIVWKCVEPCGNVWNHVEMCALWKCVH